jgi:hypothetical protein
LPFLASSCFQFPYRTNKFISASTFICLSGQKNEIRARIARICQFHMDTQYKSHVEHILIKFQLSMTESTGNWGWH